MKRPLETKDRLSKSDISIIRRVFEKLGQMNFSQLRKWSHSLPEYENVDPWEAKPIHVENLLRHLGKTDAEIADIGVQNKEAALLKVLAEA